MSDKKQGRAFTHVSLTCMPQHSFAGLPTEAAQNGHLSLSTWQRHRKFIMLKCSDWESFCDSASFGMDAFASDEARRFRERILSCSVTPMFVHVHYQVLICPDQVCYGLVKFLWYQRYPVLGSGRSSMFISFHFVNQGSLKVGVMCTQRIDVP